MDNVTDIASDLRARGLITHEGGGTLEEIIAEKRRMYLGIEPTAESMHVGNLVPIILIKHLQNMGHEPFLLVGGGTGLVGDPRESGERQLMTPDTIAENAKSVKNQLESILRVDNLEVFDNANWLRDLNLIDFLRNIGKYFTVNQLIKREIIKRRLETEEDSISYTEFSYSLLQAYDFLHLHKIRGVDLQIGGSDQWANIISGVDLIRREREEKAYALTTPIVEDRTSGKKFGKSEGNAVWLDPSRTSPFEFFQFWLNTDDSNVEEYLKIFTFLPLGDIEKLVIEHHQDPSVRTAQRKLAFLVTSFVHGDEVASAADKVSRIIFESNGIQKLSSGDRKCILQYVRSMNVKSDPEVSLVDVLVGLDLASSKGEAKRLVKGGGISINGSKEMEDRNIGGNDMLDGLVFIRKGKKVGVLAYE